MRSDKKKGTTGRSATRHLPTEDEPGRGLHYGGDPESQQEDGNDFFSKEDGNRSAPWRPGVMAERGELWRHEMLGALHQKTEPKGQKGP